MPGPSSTSDITRLVDQPLSFELERQNGVASTSGSPAPHSRWWDATFHTVTAVVGVGVLSLPYAFSYLTWTGGIISLAVTTATSLYTGYLLAALHEDKDGRRHNRYRDLGRAIFGEKWGNWAIAPFQWSVLVGLAITYTATAGQSLQAVHSSTCNNAVYRAVGAGRTDRNCSSALAWWTIVFSFFELFLSQLKDFHSLWWVSLLGAAMSAMYSTLAFATSVAAGTDGASYGPRNESSASLVLGAFNALGTIMFAFGGHAILLEVQATMQTPPSALVSMMRGLAAAYTVVVVAYFPVASAGYAAFGNLVSPDVLLSVRKPAWLISLANFMVVIHLAASYQVFAQPIFETVEAWILAGKYRLATERPIVTRAVVRCSYVALTCFLAILIPFFGDLMGLVGSLGLMPLTFLLPPALWIKATKPRGPELWFNVALMVVYGIAGVLAAIGSVYNIVIHAHEYHSVG
ncbi:Lysine histidine transporter-like 1 [Coccomyxa sp. Obi]|nr:Lysine histidine transporter-like 1 [Coccomyxa sp. Obi]